MAGQTSHMDSMSDPYTDLEINTMAQLSILESIRLHNPKVKIVLLVQDKYMESLIFYPLMKIIP